MMDGVRKAQGDLTSGKVWKVILSFSFPLLVGNLLQQLYNVVDSAIVGRFLGKEALAAVSASFFIYYFIISLVIGVGSGITVIISQHYGARRYDMVQRAFASFFIFMLAAGIALSAAGLVFAEDLFRLTKTPEDVIPAALRYFRIYIGSTFIFIAFNSLLSILRGMGDSKRPMYFIFATAFLNVALDLLFIIVFGWDIEGAAIATAAAQASGVCMALVYIKDKNLLLSLRRPDMKFDAKIFSKGLEIGLPSSVQQCSLSIGLLALLGIVNSFGTETLTAYGAAGKVESLITQAILALSSSMAAFCGQNIGAGDMKRVHQGVRFAMLINAIFSLAVFASVCLFGHEIMKVFTTDEEVVAIGYDYLMIVGAAFILHGAMNVMNGAMRGAGDTLFAMIAGVTLFWLIRIPLAYWFSGACGYRGIWYAISASFVFGFLATSAYYLSGRWKKRRVI